MHVEHSEQRPRGILSQADREFLTGERKLGSPQARSNARARIRQRVKHSFYDMMLLWRYLRPVDLRKVVQPDTKTERIRLRKSFQDTIALTVRAMDHANDDKPLRIGVALGQAGAADQFDFDKEGIHWKSGIQDSIPTKFVLEYPSRQAEEPLEDSDSSQEEQKEEDLSDDTGIGYPNRVEWDTNVNVSPSQFDEPQPDEGVALAALINDAYLEYGYLTHERVIQDRSVPPEAIAEAYNKASLEEISPQRVRRERKEWDKMGLRRPIFFYPMYRKKSSSSEPLFDEMAWAPWWQDRIIGASSDYFEMDEDDSSLNR